MLGTTGTGVSPPCRLLLEEPIAERANQDALKEAVAVTAFAFGRAHTRRSSLALLNRSPVGRGLDSLP